MAGVNRGLVVRRDFAVHIDVRYWLAVRRIPREDLNPIEEAEAYRRLRVEDFTTRSPAQLVRHLGGDPEISEVREGPLVSVIVRTRDRPELLAEALASLAEGQYRRAEVVLVNDGGAAPAVPGGARAAGAHNRVATRALAAVFGTGGVLSHSSALAAWRLATESGSFTCPSRRPGERSAVPDS